MQDYTSILAFCFTPVYVQCSYRRPTHPFLPSAFLLLMYAAPVAGLCIHSGAPDLKVGARRHDRSVLRGTGGTRVRLQAATAHQAAGRQDPHAQGEVKEEGGSLQLDL